MNDLEPREVFSIFEQITKVPRPSKKEQRISQWLVDFAHEHDIECTRDAALNVVMRVPATPGMEDKEGVILQAHMDMVCEKDGNIAHNFDTDPIETYIDGDWLKAKGTTLGGDDGIGMAMALAALTSKDLSHPAMEALFTVDEETGLTGAFQLGEGLLHGKRLINLDSEDDGQIFIGCAGGVDTVGRMHCTPVASPKDGFAFQLCVSGLTGGHSGDDINKGRANANKLVAEFLHELMPFKLQIAVIEGGNLRNAIAREAEAVFIADAAKKHEVVAAFNIYKEKAERLFGEVEKEMCMTLESYPMPETCLSHEQTAQLVKSLCDCPHGMIAMCKDIPNLVETSTNLASVKMKEGYIEICTSQRSSVTAEKAKIQQRVAACLSIACDEVAKSDGYPGWEPNVHSQLAQTTKQAYIDLFGEEPKVLAIHAGLECGLFLEKYPELDMVSIGPQMYGVHSPQERLSISSTARCWEWLKHVLAML